MRQRWFSRRALLWHLGVVIWVPGCIVAAWWQVNVALSGDHLAYLYSVEWPIFALFGLVFWWHMIHDDPESIGAKGLQKAIQAKSAEAELAGATDYLHRNRADEDEALAEYNDYLASLSSRSEKKSWRN